MITSEFFKPWWTLPAKEAAQRIVSIEEIYSKDYAWRRARARTLAGMFHGRNLDTPFTNDARFSWRDDRALATQGDVDYVPMVRNYAYKYTETAVGKIAAVDAPRPALMVTDGDWELKRKVTLRGRLLEAEYDRRQGGYATVHALAHQGLRIAFAATGSVAAKVYPWPEEDRVVVELHDTLDMFIDDTELAYGNPRTFGEVTWWPPARLAESYPEHADAIASSVEDRKDRGGLVFAGRTLRAELTPVWEAWAVRMGDGKPGRHILTLRNGTVLLDEEWDEPEPPFAFLHTSPSLAGFWSMPPMDVVFEETRKANEIIWRCDSAHRDTPKQVHYVDEKQIVDINDLLEVDTLTVVRVKNPQYTPQVHNPLPFDRIDLELLHEHESGIAETLGIADMHSGAKSEPGLPSGVAQRTVAERFDNRHAALHRAYTQWVAVDIGRLMLKAQRALYEANPSFKRRWTGDFFTIDLKAEDLTDLPEEELHVQIKPVSEKKNTPEERVQYAEELLQKGAIPFEAYMSVLEHYDVPGETKVIKTQRRWVAWQIDRWQMAKDSELNDEGFYQGPRPWMRAEDALVQVIDSLMEAELSGVPQERLQFFLDFIAELSQQMQARQGPPQAAQAPLGGMQPMAGAAPGAPPMLTPGPAVAAAPPAGPPV